MAEGLGFPVHLLRVGGQSPALRGPGKEAGSSVLKAWLESWLGGVALG